MDKTFFPSSSSILVKVPGQPSSLSRRRPKPCLLTPYKIRRLLRLHLLGGGVRSWSACCQSLIGDPPLGGPPPLPPPPCPVGGKEKFLLLHADDADGESTTIHCVCTYNRVIICFFLPEPPPPPTKTANVISAPSE